MLFPSPFNLFPLLAALPIGYAATADEWRSRSIYQLLTDRFAPPTPGAPCNTGDRVHCGGTWKTIIDKLDYVQGMGYDAIWISPTAQNIEGFTQYGEAFHVRYWTTDPTKLNPHFGTDADLKALSEEVHNRGMLLMVDVAINGLASTTRNISDASLAAASNGTLLFKKQENYHPNCDIQWDDHTSEQQCWLANNGVMLMDLNQDNEEVATTLKNWVPGYVQEYGIDGFRMDATKHMTKEWQGEFCRAAGLACFGEVAGDNTNYAASYQGGDGIDSVFGFGMMYGFRRCFTGATPQSMQTMSGYVDKAKSYPDRSLVASFLDNQDLSRFNSLESDKYRIYNAIVGTFLYGGIPAIYYGLEQDLADGVNDPHNREALWLYNNYDTTGTSYQRIKTLNDIRKKLGADDKWLRAVGSVLSWTKTDIALNREGAIIVLTNRGSSGTGTWNLAKAGFVGSADVIDLLTCDKIKAEADGSVNVTWTNGQPFMYVSADRAASAGLCGAEKNETSSSVAMSASTSSTVSASAFASTSASGVASSVSASGINSTVNQSTHSSASSTAAASGGNLIVTSNASPSSTGAATPPVQINSTAPPSDSNNDGKGEYAENPVTQSPIGGGGGGSKPSVSAPTNGSSGSGSSNAGNHSCKRSRAGLIGALVVGGLVAIV